MLDIQHERIIRKDVRAALAILSLTSAGFAGLAVYFVLTGQRPISIAVDVTASVFAGLFAIITAVLA